MGGARLKRGGKNGCTGEAGEEFDHWDSLYGWRWYCFWTSWCSHYIGWQGSQGFLSYGCGPPYSYVGKQFYSHADSCAKPEQNYVIIRGSSIGTLWLLLPVVFSGARGRPKIQLTEGMLSFFFLNGFSATTTPMLLQVSLSTVRRRIREHNMTIQGRYSSIGDQKLDWIVTSIQHRNPNCGYRMMQGYVSRLGHKV